VQRSVDRRPRGVEFGHELGDRATLLSALVQESERLTNKLRWPARTVPAARRRGIVLVSPSKHVTDGAVGLAHQVGDASGVQAAGVELAYLCQSVGGEFPYS